MGWRWSQERQDSIIVIFVTFSRKVLGRIGYRWALKRGKAINHRPRITVVTHANGIRIVGIRYVKVYLLYFFFFRGGLCGSDRLYFRIGDYREF